MTCYKINSCFGDVCELRKNAWLYHKSDHCKSDAFRQSSHFLMSAYQNLYLGTPIFHIHLLHMGWINRESICSCGRIHTWLQLDIILWDSFTNAKGTILCRPNNWSVVINCIENFPVNLNPLNCICRHKLLQLKINWIKLF